MMHNIVIFVTEHYGSTSGYNSQTTQHTEFRNFIGSILPPPPDKRLVELTSHPMVFPNKDSSQAWSSISPQLPEQVVKREIDISPENTTLIGDYTSVVFANTDTKWLIQSQGNATFSSTLALIKDHMLVVNKRYVFFQQGGNQVRTAECTKLYSQILEIVVEVRCHNPHSRIYFIGVLPRVIDNDDIKPFIVRFNHWLAASVNDINIVFEKIRFLPVHLHFIDGSAPRAKLFDDSSKLLLNSVGAALFKQVTFQLAGFVKNLP